MPRDFRQKREQNVVFGRNTYSVSSNYCLELREPYARDVFSFWRLVEREGRGEERSEHGEAIYYDFKL